jgi:hypothetical protein
MKQRGAMVFPPRATQPEVGDVFVVTASQKLRVVVRVLHRPAAVLTVPGALVVAMCEPFIADPRATIELRAAKKIGVAAGSGTRLLFHVPPAFPKAAKRLLQQTAKRLAAPSAKSIDDRWHVLQTCVEDFNALDERRAFIDTTAREQLCERIADLAVAAGLKRAEAEPAIDGWRDW